MGEDWTLLSCSAGQSSRDGIHLTKTQPENGYPWTKPKVLRKLLSPFLQLESQCPEKHLGPKKSSWWEGWQLFVTTTLNHLYIDNSCTGHRKNKIFAVWTCVSSLENTMIHISGFLMLSTAHWCSGVLVFFFFFFEAFFPLSLFHFSFHGSVFNLTSLFLCNVLSAVNPNQCIFHLKHWRFLL